MGEKAIKAAGRAQVFKQASEAEVLYVVVFVQLFVAAAAVFFPELLTFDGAWLVVPGFCVGTVALYFLCYFQQVVIEGSFVQVRSTATFFRWGHFDVGDVQGYDACPWPATPRSRLSSFRSSRRKNAPGSGSASWPARVQVRTKVSMRLSCLRSCAP